MIIKLLVEHYKKFMTIIFDKMSDKEVIVKYECLKPNLYFIPTSEGRVWRLAINWVILSGLPRNGFSQLQELLVDIVTGGSSGCSVQGEKFLTD